MTEKKKKKKRPEGKLFDDDKEISTLASTVFVFRQKFPLHP